MAQVVIKINGFTYPVGCEDGQEAHLHAMAEQIDRRVENIKALGSQGGEARMLMLACLLMADELHDLTIEMNTLRLVRNTPSPDAVMAPGPRLAEQLAHLAAKAEAIADGLEKA